MEFSIKLKKTRELLNISQEQMARKLEVSFATINRLESGKTLPCYNTLKKFEKFCELYQIKLEY